VLTNRFLLHEAPPKGFKTEETIFVPPADALSPTAAVALNRSPGAVTARLKVLRAAAKAEFGVAYEW
jgi:hypothetical protein